MSTNNISASDWALTEKLPTWAQAFRDEYPVPCYQAADALEREVPMVTAPEIIEIYVNGDDQPSFVWVDGEVLHGDFDALCGAYHAIAFEVDAMVRYVEIKGNTLIDTTAGIVWPDVITSPAAQAEMLVRLARQS